MNKKLVSILILFVGLSACATSPDSVDFWPGVDALPSAAPADLPAQSPALMLAQGSDGFMWVVGDLPADATAGRPFVARYSGDWPLTQMPRPALAYGHIAKRVSATAAVVSLDYEMPDSELTGLEITWDDTNTGIVGKGIGRVTAVNAGRVDFKIDAESGVRAGDVYGLLAPATADVQLSRRLKSVCLVESVTAELTTCRVWSGSSKLGAVSLPITGDTAVFFEHTYGLAPRPATIEVMEVHSFSKAAAGEHEKNVRNLVVKALEGFASSIPSSGVSIAQIAQQADPTKADFHRNSSGVKYKGQAQLLVGLGLVKVDGTEHLFVNYTGVGPVSGPGMVAAPPDHGIDLGPVSELTEAKINAFAGLVFVGVQIYRGQTSEGLVLLKQLLESKSLVGSMRWHARDQFAMRWLGLNYFYEALWLVQEDMVVADASKNRDAFLNALGTAVRLYDHKDLTTRALELSEQYLSARTQEKPEVPYRSALGMHVEMLLAANRIEDARAGLAELETLCPEGCGGDSVGMLSAAFWAAPQGAAEFQEEILSKITSLAEAQGGDSLAALRVYQGLRALGGGNLEEAVIAFLEAERLYGVLEYSQGVARARYFRMMTEMARKEPDAALEAGAGAIAIQRELQDFSDVSVIYERLAQLYAAFDPRQEPGPYLAAAAEVLAENVQSSLAAGNFGKAAESLFAMASFLHRIGQAEEAKMLLRRAVGFSLDSARFEMAALCHLSLAHIAREQNNFEEFKGEIGNARLMGEISKDKSVLEAIERSLTPPEPEPVDPTRLL